MRQKANKPSPAWGNRAPIKKSKAAEENINPKQKKKNKEA